MNEINPEKENHEKSLFVHAIFHSGQFDQFILIMMLSWIFASGIWLYIENRFILLGTSIFETDILPFIISYLFYFIVVFGCLVAYSSYKRMWKLVLSPDGFSLRKFIFTRTYTWEEVKFLDLRHVNAIIITGDNKFKLTSQLAKVTCVNEVPELEHVMIGRDFQEGLLFKELLQILGEAKIKR